jgi:hypothetical protein
MLPRKATGLLAELTEHSGGDKITFLSRQASAAGNIANQQCQELSEGSLGFHFFGLYPPRGALTAGTVSPIQ